MKGLSLGCVPGCFVLSPFLCLEMALKSLPPALLDYRLAGLFQRSPVSGPSSDPLQDEAHMSSSPTLDPPRDITLSQIPQDLSTNGVYF